MVLFADNDRAKLLARIGELEAKIAAIAHHERRVTIALAQSDGFLFEDAMVEYYALA